MPEQLRQSPLHDVHVSAGARMVPFAGWNMPVQYSGIIPEVKAVRESLGVFDISHMGQIFVDSPRHVSDNLAQRPVDKRCFKAGTRAGAIFVSAE
ncbi:MAG: hypothetical protein R3C19_18950 [Planctomycetaceae bacterium]